MPEYIIGLNDKTYQVSVERQEDRYVVMVDGVRHEVRLAAQSPVSTARSLMPAPQGGLAPSVAPQAPAAPMVSLGADGMVRAPMSGKILSISVKTGDQVKVGQSLMKFEAMKMETDIAAPMDGTVGAIEANVGDQVEQGDPLVELR